MRKKLVTRLESFSLPKDFLEMFLVLRKSQSLSCARFFVIPWTVAHQAPVSMEFSRQEYWGGKPFPPPGDLPDPGVLALLLLLLTSTLTDVV